MKTVKYMKEKEKKNMNMTLRWGRVSRARVYGGLWSGAT